MDSFSRLSRPEQSQVKIEPTAKACLSDGFNYPNFRLLNKQARVTASQPWQTGPSVQYNLMTIANSRGWYGAARLNGSSYELIFSTLDDLRSASKAAKDDSDNEISPRRILVMTQGKPNIIAFASQDSRLFVGLESGTILVYDSASIFSSSGGDVSPTHTIQLQNGPFRQIVPNPGTEPNLVDRVAIVGNGTVQLFNMQLESQGGWAASDASTNPVAVAWSPKGKHIAIGLQKGDILTYPLTNMGSPHKYIPPTSNANLVSLNWTGPGHTFRTSYSSPTQTSSDPSHHIIVLDTKSSTAIYYALTHPFQLSDRTFQSSYTLQLPRWDEDFSSTDHSKSLLIVGDSSSVDLEIVAHEGNNWYQQSQENPVTLPLNKSMDDTMLLSLDVDLTDISASTPIVYVYLNDGTIQGWYLEHSKPYVEIVVRQDAKAIQATGPIQTDASMSAEQDESVKPPTSSFGQSTSSQNVFSQPSAFNQPASAFSSSSGLGQPFGQQALQTASPFGQSPNPAGFNAFSSNGPPGFGQINQLNNASPFTAPAKADSSSGFGAFSGGSSSFGGGPSVFSSSNNAFNTFSNSNENNVFGQGTFGLTLTPPAPSAFVGASQSNTTGDMSREASMSDSTPSFGGLSLGSSNAELNESKPSGGIFGSFGSSPGSTQSTSSSSPFGSGGLVKPATGFGAFGNVSSGNFGGTNSALSGTNQSVIASNSQSNATPSPAFGNSSFGQSSFGQSGFGQSGFAKPAFGQTSFGSVPATGGFSSFANKPAVADSKEATGKSSFATGGSGAFSAFASTVPSGFTSALKAASDSASLSDSEPKPSTPTAPSPFGGNASPFALGFGGTNPSTASSFGNSPSPFAQVTTFGSGSTETPNKPSGFMTSPPSSPESSPASKHFTIKPPALAVDDSPPAGSPFKSSQPPVTGGAFANLQTSPSGFRPASGFGAFGGNTSTSSPFFKKAEEKTPPVSAFAALGSAGQIPPAMSAPTSGSIGTPTFGSPSLLGAPKSVFPPPTPPSPTPAKPVTSGGFGAFSSATTGFNAFSGPKKSFSDLLKTGDDMSKDPIKLPKASSILTDIPEGQKVTQEGVLDRPAAENGKTPVSVFSPPSKDAAESKRETDGEKSDSQKSGSSETVPTDGSLGDLSSAGSSFVEVNPETLSGERTVSNGEDDQDARHDEDADDTRSFLSDDFESDGSYRGDESEDEQSVDHQSDDEDEDRLSSDSRSPEPTAIPLPTSRSSSATPQPEVPHIKVTPSTSDDDELQHKKAEVVKSREASTTPPDTPANEANPSASKSPSPSPVSSTSTSSPFGLGLGRPSTRPTRSSPLASAPLSGDDDDDERETTPQPEKKAKTIPVSPKAVFSVLPLRDDTSTEEPASKRPRTPPLLSAYGLAKSSRVPGTPTLAPTTPLWPSTTPASVATEKGSNVPSFFGPPFSLVHGSTGGPFGPTAPAPLPSGSSKPPILPPATPQTPFSTTPRIPPPPEVVMEEGMQKECAMMIIALTRELDELRLRAQEVGQKREALGKSAGGSWQKVDLGDLAKWNLSDAKQFGQVLLKHQDDLNLWQENREEERQVLRELNSSMLKAGTRREEIARFNKAQNDAEFAKMLRSRTLGPEHSETQTQLRRNIRSMKDRIQKLESHLQGSKKKLAESLSGRPSIRAPSLDTINRTFRNIDIAITQQSDDVAKLASRIATLNTENKPENKLMSPTRDTRLPDPISRRPYNVTPNVAITTAAALNAERSAQKLKKALLLVRKEPLLNVKVASAPPPPVAFDTPQKAATPLTATGSNSFAFQTPLSGSLFSPPATPEAAIPDWTLPEDDFSPSASLPVRRGAGSGTKKHSSVQLKRTHGTSPPTAAPMFDWGPLPAFNNLPLNTLAASIPKFEGFGKRA